jgi:hypothetical protein
VIGAVVVAVASSEPAAAQVTITHEPDRPSLFYSADPNQDCAALFALQGDALPYHVVRLRAAAVGADSYQWTLPKPEVGFLLADEPLAPGDNEAAVRGLCGEFGNACILTKDTLKFYTLPTILYAAPTCDVLPKDTRKQFAGDSVKIKVLAKAQGKKLGKATTTIVYGDRSFAAVTLYAFGDDGVGKDAAPGGAETSFNAITTPDVLPNGPVTQYDFTWANAAGSATACGPPAAASCVTLREGLAGTFLGVVKARFADGSALCDNLNCHVGPCKFKAQVQVIRVPTKQTYTSDDPVRLRVRFANLSDAPECTLNLSGANVLSCNAEFKLGKTEVSKTTQWDFRHCSASTGTPCQSDGECPATETCLLDSHCSVTLDRFCDGDSDCEKSTEPGGCATCQNNETCIRVLAIDEADVAPGQAIDLVDEGVIVKNKIGDPVSIKETWTATAFPPTTASTSIKYKVKGKK